MKIASTKIAVLASAIAAAATLGMSSTAHAALVTYQLQVDPSTVGFVSSRAANVTAGETVTLDVFALVTNTDSNHADDTETTASLIFTSSGTMPTGTYMTPTVVSAFNATALGSVNATSTGQWGLTTATSNSTTGDYDPSSTSGGLSGTGAGSGATALQLGTIQYVVAAGATSGQTVNLVPAPVARTNGNGAGYNVTSDGVNSTNGNSAANQAVGTAAVLTLSGGSSGPAVGVFLSNGTTPALTGSSLGTITVLNNGANKYNGQILTLAANSNSGNVGINQIGQFGETTGTEVLLWLAGDTPANIETALASSLTADGATALTFAQATSANDTDALSLFNNYGNGDQTVGLLLRFPNGGTGGFPTGYNAFFNFTLPTGDSVTAITAVPEPASLGLLALGGLGLIGRRRRSSK